MFRLLILTALTSVRAESTTFAATTTMAIKAVDFEVFGRVQGVFFRKTGCFHTTSSESSERHMENLISTDFEVYGNVQGVYFRVYTKQQAEKLNLRGWCKNTPQGTVQGHVQGPAENIQTMMHWLKNTGSPSSKIEKVEFRNQKEISEYTYQDFGIIRE